MLSSPTQMMSDSCEVLVVGLGPAGALTAINLARAGHDVLAIDKAAFPRYKVCGGCLNVAALDALEAAGVSSADLGGFPLNEFELAVRNIRLHLPLPGGRAVSRARLDALLALHAARAGARVHTGTRAESAEPTDVGWQVRMVKAGRSHTIRARYVVAADGLGGDFGPRHVNVTTELAHDSLLGAGTHIAACERFEPGRIYMAVGKGGYVGLARVEDRGLTIAAALSPRDTRESGALGAVIERILNEAGLPIPGHFSDATWRGTPPLTRRTHPVAAQAMFTLGDAAGYVEPFTGEGMAWGALAADRLARILHETLSGNQSEPEARWTREYQKTLSSRQNRCRWIARGLRSPALTATVATVLTAVPALAAPVVRQLNAVTR